MGKGPCGLVVKDYVEQQLPASAEGWCLRGVIDFRSLESVTEYVSANGLSVDGEAG